MPTLAFSDPKTNLDAWAARLQISREAVEVYATSDVIDLHIDSFIWTRIFGYDLSKRHGGGVLGRHFYSHCDFPRAMEAGLTGGVWLITTNPFLPAKVRRDLFFRNLRRFEGEFEKHPDVFRIVRTTAQYREARAAGLHGVFLGVQGGNCLDYDLRDFDRLDPQHVLRITLVHLSNSSLGGTSSPASRLGGSDDGLTNRGREYIEVLNEKKIFVDLAHISRRGFFDAVAVHDKTQPLMVTHTGIAGVYEHWRNLTDAQVRAVADTGGCVGVMFQSGFLAKRGASVETIVDHIAHIIDIAGEDVPAIGTDYDGAISPPPELPTIVELPRVADAMLRRGWSAERVQKILGGNFLNVVERLRG
ncbi:MAG: membrane dipeptidase [Polyangiales bacterium]|nr:membrane dipeptidase [Myxococcales bacterium]MCB9661957.1 membrane dipeptidase [Sandaracinaceae bacterium]